MEATYLIGALGAVAFAVVGLFMDARRMAALIALIVAVLSFVVCGLPLLV